MQTYSAINIGPIADTFSMARKPRELWAASYMFSHLMEEIIYRLDQEGYNIISPCKVKPNGITGVGVFPDRVFFEGKLENNDILKNVIDSYSQKLNVDNLDRFFNLMTVSIEKENEKNVIKYLNELLNSLELCNSAQDEKVKSKVLELIQKRNASPLFNIALNSNSFSVMSFPEIATQELKQYSKTDWEKIVSDMKKNDNDEDDNFYSEIKSQFKDKFKSYHKYICIVQADGDNMGEIVSNLSFDKVTALSSSLMKFSVEASQLIHSYGGMPVYAGGDDLLFFAPVVSYLDNRKTTIFELIDRIDNQYREIGNLIDSFDLPADVKKKGTSMSYGISITYHKYPLYEALGKAGYLLFGKAKKTTGKQTIAWDIQKHSGSTFSGLIPKKYKDLQKAFECLLLSDSIDSKTTSSLAHKLRAASGILNLLWYKPNDIRKIRLNAFMRKAMDMEDKDEACTTYIENVTELILELYTAIEDMEKNSPDKSGFSKENLLNRNIYNMLRTAKFINGEEDNYE